MILLAWVAFICAVIPALLYLWNSFLFREPPEIPSLAVPERPRVSVLIPARNEEHGIAACVESILASCHVELEVIVLDDHSTDRTGEIVREIAVKDPRVRLEMAPPLPAGWCGKQAACYTLSRLARFDQLAFLDADVRLEPDALARMASFLHTSRAALVSGFPRQETGTSLEKLLIPLIHWLLLGFLPIWAMRRFRWSAFGAGCGQWFQTTREAYQRVGGHAAVKSSLHDGLTLPRAYRRAGLMTDICDATDLATCRMYRSSRAVWYGLAKNAREGLAATGQIGFWTAALLLGQVCPFILLAAGGHDAVGIRLALLAILGTGVIRASMAVRFRQSLLGFALHPVAVLLLLAIQWYAILRAIAGKPVGWKGRAHPRVA